MQNFFRLISIFLIPIFCLLLASDDVLAAAKRPVRRERWREDKSTLHFHFGVWDAGENEVGIEVTRDRLSSIERLTQTLVSGFGVGFAYNHRLSPGFAWEIKFSGFAYTEVKTLSELWDYRDRYDYYETISSNTHQVTIAPLTVGGLFYPIRGFRSSLRPYVCGGIGSYFAAETSTESGIRSNNTLVDFDLSTTFGGYIGGGVDFAVSRHFLLNIDSRYHLVKFSEEINGVEDYSGPQFVGGFKIVF